MILRSPLSIPPNPLAGPRKVGDETDYIETDPANGRINAGGTASPLIIGNLSLPVWIPPQPGQHTTGLMNGATGFGMAFGVANYLYAVPFILPEELTFDALTVAIATAAASSTGRIGIYNINGGLPSSLLVEATADSQIDTSTTGVKTATFTAEKLAAGTYLFAWEQSSSTVKIKTSVSSGVAGLHVNTETTQMPVFTHLYRDLGSFVAMPDPFGDITAYASGDTPRIAIRRQA